MDVRSKMKLRLELSCIHVGKITLEKTRRAQASEQLQKTLDGLRSVGLTAQVLLRGAHSLHLSQYQPADKASGHLGSR